MLNEWLLKKLLVIFKIMYILEKDIELKCICFSNFGVWQH